MGLDRKLVRGIVEGAIFASPVPMPVEELQQLFVDSEKPGRQEILRAISDIQSAYADRAVELIEVSSGYRFQVRKQFAPWVGKLWEEKPQRLSRALLETLAIIAYRQPVTRAEIENIRGVVVSTQIIRTLLDRDWIAVAGHREVPGRPALLATTRQFLDAFSLKSLAELPPLAAVRDMDSIARDLEAQLAGAKQKELPNEGLVSNE
ncbi:condensin subunit ScpB [Fluviicoccus keumensis]|uniref:Condensin subunit ScpB n=1 Tax=Fluviicoccus keumensis TaxID=1435465 RepID=A0A4Q7Z3F1_9GAMM|nr:SMC-Scp complex subunit ScpB [Fluviicoccus keumensis]RZU44892.1 condensin subunit ScpB [Fluviicoccus keumensis]